MTTDPRLHALTTTLLHEMSIAHAADVANLELIESNLQGLIDELELDEQLMLSQIKQAKTDAIVEAQETADAQSLHVRQRSQAMKAHVSSTLEKVRLNLQKAKAPVNDETSSQMLEGSKSVPQLNDHRISANGSTKGEA